MKRPQMKRPLITIATFLIASGFCAAGVANSPWSFDDKAKGWSLEDKDQEIAKDVKIEFLILSQEHPVRLVAISAPVRPGENALRDFAQGIQKSFAKNGVVDLKDSEGKKWGFDGLSMAFTIPSDTAPTYCDAFFFTQNGKFWAAMTFGPDSKDLPKAFLALKNGRIEQGGGGQPATRPESK
jgi:hypothetical protein